MMTLLLDRYPGLFATTLLRLIAAIGGRLSASSCSQLFDVMSRRFIRCSAKCHGTIKCHDYRVDEAGPPKLLSSFLPLSLLHPLHFETKTLFMADKVKVLSDQSIELTS
eukprot:scaffold1801_cov96-Skeletonema_marinoi.AAC.3